MHEIDTQMSATELKEWISYAQEEPFGDIRADYRSAIVALTVSHSAGSKKTKLSDFLPFIELEVAASPKVKAAAVQEAFLKATAGLKKRVMRRN